MPSGLMQTRRVLALFFFCLCTFSAAAAARRSHIVFMVGEQEYKTRETLPVFAKAELDPAKYRVTFIEASPEKPNEFPGLTDALQDADLLFLSVRRRTPPRAELEAVRRHLENGKPLVGIRTACHAFALRGSEREAELAGRGLAAWQEFDPEVLGGHYTGHYAAGPKARISIAPGAESDPLLRGIPVDDLPGNGSLYKVSPVQSSAHVLLMGTIPGEKPEPVAWTHLYGAKKTRIFYTSLGHPDDFKNPAFRRLLVHGIQWALNEPASAAASRAAVPHVPNEAPDDSKPRSPSEALQQFEVADDLQLDQLLTEPLIAQPVFLNFDERGRMWVVQYRQYPAPAGLKMVSRDSFWRAVYDKVPPPPPHQFRGRDRITIHEDTDGDGIFDKTKVFVDGLNITTAVERGRGGVWVLNPPYLLFYPDANNDDVPDSDPVVHLTGFGLEDTHSVVNSLRWGPDGWLYGAQGSTVTAHVRRPGVDEPEVFTQGQNIWRYQPESRRFEIFAEGGGNAFGVELDAKGRIFSGHNGGNTRGFHYMQGAYLQKGFEKHGPLSNPYAYGYFPPMPHPDVERFTHTFIIYDGGALPEHYWGKLFGAEPLQGRVVESEIIPDRSSFRTYDISRPLVSRDRWFRPVDIKVGPDGAIYVCDWYDQQINHYRNQEGRIDPGNGRIYRLRGKGARPLQPFDLGALSSEALVGMLNHKNKWFRQTALRLLADRHDRSVLPRLRALVDGHSGQLALESLWALNLCGGLDDAAALEMLDHPDPYVRLWTVRLLCDAKQVAPAMASRLARLAAGETNLEVRDQLACSARRLPAEDCLAIVRPLLEHDEDADDNRMPLLLWWAIESKVANDRGAVLALFESSPLWERPLVHQHILERLMRRFAQSGTRPELVACARLLDLAPTTADAQLLMKGFEAGLQGRTLPSFPDELLQAMARRGVGSVALGVRRGDGQAIDEALRTTADESAPLERRLEYLAVLGEVPAPGAVPVLLNVAEKASQTAVRKAAFSALQAYNDPEIGRRVVALYSHLDADSLVGAQLLLASRSAWSRALVEAVVDGRIAKKAVPLNLVRKIKMHADDALARQVGEDLGRDRQPDHSGDGPANQAAQRRHPGWHWRSLSRSHPFHPDLRRLSYALWAGRSHRSGPDGLQAGRPAEHAAQHR